MISQNYLVFWPKITKLKENHSINKLLWIVGLKCFHSLSPQFIEKKRKIVATHSMATANLKKS
jgi:hypothetical protein